MPHAGLMPGLILGLVLGLILGFMLTLVLGLMLGSIHENTAGKEHACLGIFHISSRSNLPSPNEVPFDSIWGGFESKWVCVCVCVCGFGRGECEEEWGVWTSMGVWA